MADPFAPSDGTGPDPDLNRNLLMFGLATMAAGGQRDANGLPMSTLGAIGQGGMQALSQGRQTPIDRTEIGLKKANTEYLGAEAQQKRMTLALQIQQQNMMRATLGLPPLDMNSLAGSIPGGGGASGGTASAGAASQPMSMMQPDTPENRKLSSAAQQYSVGMPGVDQMGDSPRQSSGIPSAGMTSAPSAGYSPPSASPQMTIPGNAGPSLQDMQAAPGPLGVPMAVWQGKQAPSKAQAMSMANYFDIAGQKDQATKLREYALKSDGSVLGPNYEQGLDPNFIRGQGQLESTKQWAGVAPHIAKEGGAAAAKAPWEIYVNRMKPESFRGPGAARYDPFTGQTIQIPNEIKTVDENGRPITKFVPLGVDISGPGGDGRPQNTPPNGGPPPGVPMPNGTPPAMPGGGGGAPRSMPQGPAPQAPAAQPPMSPGPASKASPAENPHTSGYVTGLSPGMHEAIAGAQKNYQDEGKKAFGSAADLKGSIEYIKRDLDSIGKEGFLSQGNGADLRFGFAKAINTAANIAGVETPFDPNKVGAWEDFLKESKLGGMKGLSAIFGGSREAASIIQTSMSAFPHPENSYEGAKLLVNAFDEAANREIDKRNFETNWLNKHDGNLVGANEAFNQQFPAPMYTRRAISQVKPYEVKSPDEMKRYMPGTLIKTPGGIKMVPGSHGITLSDQPQAQQ